MQNGSKHMDKALEDISNLLKEFTIKSFEIKKRLQIARNKL